MSPSRKRTNCSFGILFVILICFSSCNKRNEENMFTVTSPDSLIRISTTLELGRLYYQVLYNLDTVIKKSQMGIYAEGNQFAENLKYKGSVSRTVQETYAMQIGKRKDNVNHANERVLTFENARGTSFQIILRAYNDGVAFRYSFSEGKEEITILKEATTFAIPQKGQAWLQPYELASEYTPAYEGRYTSGSPIGESAADSSGWSMPALFNSNGYWVLLAESDLNAQYFGSHLQQNSDRGIYRIASPLYGEALGRGKITATTMLPLATPWRVIMLGKTVGTIVESNLVYHLASPSTESDVSWIKPGRSSWSWWGAHDSGKDFETLKKFVDLAKDMGWEYSLVDANWDLMKGGTIEELARYAVKKGVGLTLWYNSGGDHNKVTERPRNIMNDSNRRKEEFKKLRGWGVKGVKVDFFQSDKQDIIKLYFDILKDAAAEHIAVVFHGCTVPRGWSRTYPNLLSMEAVRGAEQYGWDPVYAKKAPAHNITLMFTRNVVGPMDFTPVTFSDYACCPHVTSNAYELALSVVMESGILHFADKEAYYRKLDQRIRHFLSSVPVTWDDTKFVEGEPSKLMVLARRKGNEWFVAGANGENVSKSISLSFSFLPEGKYKLIVFSDGASGKEIKIEELRYSTGQARSVSVLPNGGFVIWVMKED
jgi:alpha-glucosidase